MTERAVGGATTAVVEARAAAAAPGSVLATPGVVGTRIRIVPAIVGPPDEGPTHQGTGARAEHVPTVEAGPARRRGSVARDTAAEMEVLNAASLAVPSRRTAARPPEAARPAAGTAARPTRSAAEVKPGVELGEAVRATATRVRPEATHVDAARAPAEAPPGVLAIQMTAEQTVTGKGNTAQVVTGAGVAAVPAIPGNVIGARLIARRRAPGLTAATVARDRPATAPANVGRIEADVQAAENHGTRAVIVRAMLVTARPAGPVGTCKVVIRGVHGRGRATRATRTGGKPATEAGTSGPAVRTTLANGSRCRPDWRRAPTSRKHRPRPISTCYREG